MARNRFEKLITFCGQTVKVACDGQCAKAWGSNSRSRVRLSDNEDDFAWLADNELGAAPANPGTREGGEGKPTCATGPEDLNRWCVRECERMSMSEPGGCEQPLALRDFSRRLYNIPSSDPARWS